MRERLLKQRTHRAKHRPAAVHELSLAEAGQVGRGLAEPGRVEAEVAAKRSGAGGSCQTCGQLTLLRVLQTHESHPDFLYPGEDSSEIIRIAQARTRQCPNMHAHLISFRYPDERTIQLQTIADRSHATLSSTPVIASDSF